MQELVKSFLPGAHGYVLLKACHSSIGMGNWQRLDWRIRPTINFLTQWSGDF